MALKEVMRYAIELGFDGKDAERDSAKTFDKIEDNAEDSAGKFDGIGGKMGKALVAGFAAVGAGALIMQGINQALDKQAGERLLQGQFDLTAKDAQKYGKLAGDLYADGWGAGIQEVQQVVGLAAQKLGTTTDAELSKISESVLAVSKTWGEDFDSVIRSTNQLMQNDLAPNAEAALDLIVAAFQNGGNEASDLLDTIDEYSQHWAAMGLSGEDALNQIIHGFQNGQRDADKMGDAVKEMGLRIREGTQPVRDALQDIGLDADEVIEAFNRGGPAAREAFLEVVAALQDTTEAAGGEAGTQAAVKLIGTQFEDLGPRALDSLEAVDGALDVTTGKAQGLADTVEATKWEKNKREAEGYLTSLGGMALEGVNKFFGAFEGGPDKQFGRIFDEMGEGVVDVTADLGEFDRAARGAASGGRDVAEANSFVASEVDLASEALRDEAKAGHWVATVLGDVADETDEAGAAAKRAAKRVEDLEDAFSDLNDEMSDRSAWLDVEDAAADFADAITDAEAATEEFGAESKEAEQANRDMERALMGRIQSIQEYVKETEGIPAEVATDIVALLDQGSVDEAEAILRNLERHRTTVLNIQTRLRNAPSSDFGFTPQVSGGNPNAGQTGLGAHGGIVTQATRAIIGEAGPEAVIPLDQMPGASPLGGGMGRTLNVNITGQLDQRAVGELHAMLKKWERGQI